jgi:outer membrane biosynthesis protein TonB
VTSKSLSNVKDPLKPDWEYLVNSVLQVDSAVGSGSEPQVACNPFAPHREPATAQPTPAPNPLSEPDPAPSSNPFAAHPEPFKAAAPEPAPNPFVDPAPNPFAEPSAPLPKPAPKPAPMSVVKAAPAPVPPPEPEPVSNPFAAEPKKAAASALIAAKQLLHHKQPPQPSVVPPPAASTNRERQLQETSAETQKLEAQVHALRWELCESALVEAAVLCHPAAHGKTAHEIHAPARHLAAALCNPRCAPSLFRRAVEALAAMVLAAGDDLPRAAFWCSNAVALRACLSARLLQQQQHDDGQSPAVRAPPTATHKLRIVTLGTGRQKRLLERWTNLKHSRRTCTCECELRSWRGKSAGVAKRPRERSPTRNPLRYDSHFLNRYTFPCCWRQPSQPNAVRAARRSNTFLLLTWKLPPAWRMRWKLNE